MLKLLAQIFRKSAKHVCGHQNLTKHLNMNLIKINVMRIAYFAIWHHIKS